MNPALSILDHMLYYFCYPNLFSDSVLALVLNLNIVQKLLQPPGLGFPPHFEAGPYVFIPYT